MNADAAPGFDWTPFAAPDALAEGLADHVAASLERAVAERGAACLAVSGGTTPVRFFQALSRRDLTWPKVTVTLVDERLVPPSSPRSNERLARDNLLRNAASGARFVGLYSEAPDAEEAARAAESRIANVPSPFDVVVLGMGADGHTASFFPDADDLAALLDLASPRNIAPVTAASAGEARLTLTLPVIASARSLIVHIEGEEKRRVFEAAMAANTRPLPPIRHVLDAAESVPQIFWAPSEGRPS